MKIRPLMRKFVNKVQDYHNTRIDRLAKEHVQIHEKPWIKNETLDQIRSAQRTLGNYARKENVKIDIYNGDHILNEHVTAKEEKAVENKLFVTVTDLRNSRQKQALLPNNPADIYQYNQTKYRIYQTSEETEYSRPYSASSHEDSFIRTLYRTVSKMVNDLKTTK